MEKTVQVHRGSRKQAACVCAGLQILHHAAVAKDTFGRSHWSRQDGQATEPCLSSSPPEMAPYRAPAAALLSRRRIQFKMGFLSPLCWQSGARKGHLLSRGTGSGRRGSVLSHVAVLQQGPCTILSSFDGCQIWISLMSQIASLNTHLLNPYTAHTTGEPHLILAPPSRQLCSSLTPGSNT